MDLDTLMTLRDDIAAAVAAANSATDTANAATADAAQVRTEVANDRAAAAAALATATTNMATATTERTAMEKRLSTATTLINTLQVQLAAQHAVRQASYEQPVYLRSQDLRVFLL